MKKLVKKILKEEIAKNLNPGDLVVVNGVFKDSDDVKIFKELKGVIIEQRDFDNYFLIKFFDWENGHDGWKTPGCGMNDCFYLPKNEDNGYFTGDIELVSKKFTADDISDIFSSLNENEDGWWDEIVKNIENDPNQKIKINFYQDIFSENIVLNPGDHINIEIYEDGLYINGDATIVRKGEGSDYYLLKLPNIMIFGDDEETTHCGKQQDGKICECIEGGNGFSGKCWWVELSHADSLYLYTKRKGF